MAGTSQLLYLHSTCLTHKKVDEFNTKILLYSNSNSEYLAKIKYFQVGKIDNKLSKIKLSNHHGIDCVHLLATLFSRKTSLFICIPAYLKPWEEDLNRLLLVVSPVIMQPTTESSQLVQWRRPRPIVTACVQAIVSLTCENHPLAANCASI